MRRNNVAWKGCCRRRKKREEVDRQEKKWEEMQMLDSIFQREYLGDICAGAGHVPRLRRELAHDRLDPGTLANDLNEPFQRYRVAVSEVVYLVPS